MPTSYTDYLETPVSVGGVTVSQPYVGRWVRLVSNSTGTAYVSTNSTDANGMFTFTNLPSDSYTVYSGPTSGGAWTGTGDTAYQVGLSSPINYAPSGLPPMQFFDAFGGALATDVADYKFYRNANYTGGTHGFVNSAIRVQTDIAAGVTAYEWGFLSILNNNATDTTSENVALAAQANKNAGAAGTWGLVIQATDTSGSADKTTALIGMELDFAATGTDANVQRIGFDMVLSTQSGAAAHGGIGFRVNAASTALWDVGIQIKNIGQVALEIRPTAAAFGIDMTNGTFSSAAIRLARQHRIILEASNTFQIETVGAADSIFKFINGGSEKVGIDLNTGLRMNATQVVTARQTGYTNAWTGTPERATALATGSATLVQVAQRLAAIQTDLVTHGLIGP